jgi:hypothetical protein
MPDDRPSEKDEALSKLLKTWKPEGQLPPRFQETVWRRIESAEAACPPGLLGLLHALRLWIEKTFSRPALAGCYIAVLLVAGVGAGFWHAEGTTAQSESEWRVRYVQSIDPYQMPRN